MVGRSSPNLAELLVPSTTTVRVLPDLLPDRLVLLADLPTSLRQMKHLDLTYLDLFMLTKPIYDPAVLRAAPR